MVQFRTKTKKTGKAHDQGPPFYRIDPLLLSIHQDFLPFEELMRRHEREIMRYLLRVSGNREDAADLFQETWLRAYRAYPRLNPESEARPWLYAIATNLCRNRARDRARHAQVVVDDDEEHSAVDRIGKAHRSLNENDGYAVVRM